MHHKHKRTVRKELKRYDHKSARAKEKTALDGGHPGQARGMSWSNSIPQPPIVDEVGLYKKMRGKKRPPKERCPVNGTHEWYRETVTRTEVHISGRQGYWDCESCRVLRAEASGEGWYWRTYCPAHKIETPYEVQTNLATCIHCWVEKKRVKQPRTWRLISRERPYKPRQAYRRPKG